jgi:hypothetical protein
MTTMKPFPRLLVPRPPPKTSASSDPVMHACRPVDHVKPPPRIVTQMAPGVAPKRPEPPAPVVEHRVTPAFVTGVKRPAAAPAGDSQTGGMGKPPRYIGIELNGRH